MDSHTPPFCVDVIIDPFLISKGVLAHIVMIWCLSGKAKEVFVSIKVNAAYEIPLNAMMPKYLLGVFCY